MCRNPSVSQLTQKTVRPDDYRTVTRAAAGWAIGCSRQGAGRLIAAETGQSEPRRTAEDAANDHDPFSAASKCLESSHSMSHHRHEPTVVVVLLGPQWTLPTQSTFMPSGPPGSVPQRPLAGDRSNGGGLGTTMLTGMVR
jgi:hypothetical protein